ncbi:hypothetical protein KUTeg_023083 [Tegillarca granosa]|uniref:Uncharacterized protein n=1 Tax=Tegillarca granosa TaxID=220873 RepID=A0ABQ9E6V3_TEGGR|nr:hypothetical protein KUTeg_023083 [Tegillarca granosa]
MHVTSVSTAMNFGDDLNEIPDDDVIFYSVLYSSVTVVFAMAVLSKFLTNEFRFGFRSFLSLVVLFLGEPLCQFLIKGPGGVCTFAVCCLLVYSVLPASHLPVGNKAVLITGSDTGFGHALVKKLDSIGMRNIEAAFEYVSNIVGEEGLWGLVNNAGVWYFSEIEMTSEQIFHKVLDINLFGRLTMEGNGAYSVSKHENMKEHSISRKKDEVWQTMDEKSKEDYGQEYLETIYKSIIDGSDKYPDDLTPVIRAMRSGLLSKRPRERYPCGTGAEILMTLYPLLPVWLADKLVSTLGILPKNIKPSSLQ